MKNRVNALQENLRIKKISEFEVSNYSDFTLKIIGSFDFAYYHDVEIIFSNVTYISCPSKFGCAKIRLANQNETNELLEELNLEYLEDDDLVFCFAIDEESDKNSVQHYIIANDMRFECKLIKYYAD